MAMFAPPVIKLCRRHLFDHPKVGDSDLTCSYCKMRIPFSQFKNECDAVGRMLMDANAGSSRRVPCREATIKSYTAWAKQHGQIKHVQRVADTIRKLTGPVGAYPA